jgi:hypothetical protein
MLYSEIKNNQELIHNLKIKSYLPILLKDAIINGINNDSLEIDGLLVTSIIQKDSMWCVKYAHLEVSKFYLIVLLYTDIVFDTDDSLFDMYDFFVESCMYDIILSKISDINFLNDLIEKEITQYLALHNSLEYTITKVLGDNLSKFVEKIPDEKGMEKLLKLLPNAINKVKPEYMDLIKDLMKKG